MKKEIRIKRNNLRDGSIRLKELAFYENAGNDTNFKIREKQEKQYKKYLFYDGFIKAMDKEKSVENVKDKR